MDKSSAASASAPPPPPPQMSCGAGAMATPPSYDESMSHQKVEGGAPPPGGFMYKAPNGAPGIVPPAPAGGYPGMVPPPQPIGGPTPVIVNYINPPNFGPRSVRMTCPQCQSQISTATTSEPGPMAWILAGVLCFLGFWACACIPCCVDSLNSVTHKCPNCNSFLGRYKGGM